MLLNFILCVGINKSWIWFLADLNFFVILYFRLKCSWECNLFWNLWKWDDPMTSFGEECFFINATFINNPLHMLSHGQEVCMAILWPSFRFDDACLHCLRLCCDVVKLWKTSENVDFYLEAIGLIWHLGFALLKDHMKLKKLPIHKCSNKCTYGSNEQWRFWQGGSFWLKTTRTSGPWCL